MDLQYLADYISIPLPDAWSRHAQAAWDCYDPNWLNAIDFDGVLAYYGYEDGWYYDRLHTELELLKRDAALNRVCWLMHYILFQTSGADYMSIWGWDNENAFGHHGSHTICVVALLAGQPIHAKNMEMRGFDSAQIQHHKQGVRAVWTGEHSNFGYDGIRFSRMIWGTYFMRCYMTLLGRLEYEIGLKRYPYLDQAFNNPATVYIHIPRGDGLRDEDVAASIALAREKLPAYFPEIEGKKLVFCTRTWMLDPELEQMLPPESNILKFQRRFQIFEKAPGEDAYLTYVFMDGRRAGTFDYGELPENGSLQRKVKQRLLAGQPLHVATGYFE